jgi:hypothetical protein
MSKPRPSTCSSCKEHVAEVKYSYIDNCIYCYDCYDIKKLNIKNSLVWKRGVWKVSKNSTKTSLAHAFARDSKSLCGKFDINSTTYIEIFESKINPCQQCARIIKRLIK